MADPAYPDFEQAQARLLAFAQTQGLALPVVYINADALMAVRGQWLVRRGAPDRARRLAKRRYEVAVKRGLGVALTGCCVFDGALGVCVQSPVDEDEAQRMMYTDGLKLSIRAELPRAQGIGMLRWLLLRLVRCLRPRTVVRFIDMYR